MNAKKADQPSRWPQAANLSIAILENLVKPVLGEDGIGIIRQPLVDKERMQALQDILLRTERNFRGRYHEKEPQLCDALLDLPLATLPGVQKALWVFCLHPTDSSLARLLGEEMLRVRPRLPQERIHAAVDAYLRLLKEELVELPDVREKLQVLASLGIHEETTGIHDDTTAMLKKMESLDEKFSYLIELFSRPAPPVSPSQPPSNAHDEAQKARARRAYLEAVIRDNGVLRLAVLDEHAGDPGNPRLSLEDVYIDLNTTQMVEVEGEKDEKRPLPVLEALCQAKGRRMVLLGFPGTGKSTFVRYLALRMAQELTGRPRQLKCWKGEALLPVAVSLGRFAESLPQGVKKGSCRQVEDFLRSTLAGDKDVQDFAPFLLPTLEQEGGLFLFDGLDEVANLELRPVVVEAVESFAEHYGRHPHSRFLVTCRTYSYHQDSRWHLPGWTQYDLDLLNDEQIAFFVNAWYDQHIAMDEKRTQYFEDKKVKLMQALSPDDRRKLLEVARYPIILTVMAVVHVYSELPDSRAQVYEKCVTLLLEKWNAERPIQGVLQKRNILEELGVPRSLLDQALYEIAFEAHRARKDASGGLVDEALIREKLHDHLDDFDKVKTFLEYCQGANGLLMLQGTVLPAGRNAKARRVYTFPHLTFEEYLAALYLREEDSQVARRLLDEAHDRWRVAVTMLADHLCFTSPPSRAGVNALLEELSALPDQPSNRDWRALWLAGELLLLYRRAFPQRKSPWEDDILQNLRCLVSKGHLSLVERAAAADVLGELGHLPPDLCAFVPIPNDQNEQFRIARYPVTNAQYRAFLESGEFAEKKYWMDFPRFSQPDKEGRVQPMQSSGDEGWQWLQANLEKGAQVVLPRFWHDPRFGMARPGAPVVGVTWFEANAFCRWLLENWDTARNGAWAQHNPGWRPETLRLPTEPEWLLAAGGGVPQERYPWDPPNYATTKEAEIIQRANVSETGIGRTTPVDMFPLGESLCKVLDMAGNVWEWQANFYDKGQDWFALRGGSWANYHRVARPAFRDNFSPDYQWFNSGFRLCAPPR